MGIGRGFFFFFFSRLLITVVFFIISYILRWISRVLVSVSRKREMGKEGEGAVYYVGFIKLAARGEVSVWFNARKRGEDSYLAR